MEQDIDDLEELRKELGLYANKNKIKQGTALEHLIKAYKELEEKVMQKDLEIIGVEEYTKASMGEIIEHYYTANEDCIPTSKIKEKIEELNKEEKQELKGLKGQDRYFVKQMYQYKISILQELLERRKYKYE